jgi:transglutaminase-like putative cysteine protease
MSQTDQQRKPLADSTIRLLGVTVLLTQLPLLLHLPLWICLPGALLVFVRVVPSLHRRLQLPAIMMTPLVLIGAVAIAAHYGQIFNRDPCVAFLFLLVGFKYLESKSTHDASLLVVLSAFLLMTQFFYWQSIAAAMFAIPALFFIGLSLFTLQRGDLASNPRLMVHLTAKLMLQAIPVAALLFVAVPRVSSPGFGDGSGSASTGLSSRMSPGSISSLSLSNEVAFRVEFDEFAPDTHDLYWRGPVLSGFNGREWFILPRATHPTFANTTIAADTAAPTINYTVTMEPTPNPWLLALDVPSVLPGRTKHNAKNEIIARITEEKQLDSLIRLNKVIRYHTGSVLTDRFRSTTRPGAEYLLTTEHNPRAQQFAKRLRIEHKSDRDVANAILRWFSREKFQYTLSPPKLGEHAIDDFLFESRQGFCEHYSGSFVLMLRAAGIPARVVTGYQGGELNGDYMIIRQSDAHAWTEAYIDGHWQRFDPTGAVAPQRVERGIGEALRGERTNSYQQWPWVRSINLQWDKLNYQWQSIVVGFDAGLQNRLWQKLGLQQPGALGLILMIFAVVAVWIVLILAPWRALLNRNRRDRCQQQWQRLCEGFERRGMGRTTGETADAYISRLSRHLPQQVNHLAALRDAYYTGRYGAGSQDPAVQKASAAKMRAARRALGQRW